MNKIIWIFSLSVCLLLVGIMLFVSWQELTKTVPNPAIAWGLFAWAYMLFMWAVIMVGSRRREYINHGRYFKNGKPDKKEPSGFGINGKAHSHKQNRG